VPAHPVIARSGKLLHEWKKNNTHLPSSLMGKAIDYTLTLWDKLQEHVRDGRVEIDNNLVENAIRPTAVGRKNWLFIGEEGAGERSAIMFTIIEASRSRRIVPWEYLRDVLSRLPSMTNKQLKEVTPEAWAKARRQTQRAKKRVVLAAQCQAAG
jgi:hypothetical protein